ncbi:MAG: glycosyltransferase family 4 protein [Candidatus Dormibacteraceae bacterium]
MPDRRLSVAFDMTFPNRNQSGSGTYARSLVAALEARDDIRTITVSAAPGANFAGTLSWLLRGASARLTANPTSLLHCPTFVTPWNLPVPFVTTVLDLSTRRFPQDFPLEWRAYERWLVPGRARAAALVVAISEVTRRDVIAEYGVPPDRVLTIHPGIDPMFFAAPPALPPSAPLRLLFPGAPVARKNLDLVLHCLAAAPDSSATAGAKLDISGARAEAFPAVVELISSLGLADRVNWLGLIDRDRMPELMARASVVLYPSFYEGFGLPPLEAMAAGSPVIASNASCLPEVLGDAAILIDPTDSRAFAQSLEAVLTRGEVREGLVAAGRARARLFTWERCAERTVEAYRHALQVAA